MRLAVAIAALALLAGCHQQPAKPGPSATANAGAGAGATAVKKPADPSPSASATAAAPQGRVLLDAQGIALGRTVGSSQHFDFGAPQAAVEKAAVATLGEGRHSANAECGGGPMTFADYGPLRLSFQDGHFAGWLAKEGPTIVTSDGIRPGALMRDLRITRSARMLEDSTLEGEFDYLAADGNTIAGFVSGTGRDAKIASLYAGDNCFFR